MAWFFIEEEITSSVYLIWGEDALHIKKSLRMKPGEEVTLVSPSMTEYTCKITDTSGEAVAAEVVSRGVCSQEAKTQVTLYQALTKGDKMDFIIQKCVELGVSRIVPVVTSRCISRPDEKSIKKKVLRWQKIALGAAQQSRRGIVPQVCETTTLSLAAKEAAAKGTSVVFYEKGGESIKKLIAEDENLVSIFVGCEGGFEEEEIALLNSLGTKSATLGKRILRAETAPITALSAIMFHTGNLD